MSSTAYFSALAFRGYSIFRGSVVSVVLWENWRGHGGHQYIIYVKHISTMYLQNISLISFLKRDIWIVENDIENDTVRVPLYPLAVPFT